MKGYGNLSFRYLKEPFVKISHIGKQVMATSVNSNAPNLINRQAYTIRKFSPNVKSKPVYTTEKLDTDPSRKAYGTDKLARVNYTYYVF